MIADYCGQSVRMPALAFLGFVVTAAGFEKWRVEWGRRAVLRDIERRPTWTVEQINYRFSFFQPAWIVRYDVVIQTSPSEPRRGRATVRGSWVGFADPEVEIDFDGA